MWIVYVGTSSSRTKKARYDQPDQTSNKNGARSHGRPLTPAPFRPIDMTVCIRCADRVVVAHIHIHILSGQSQLMPHHHPQNRSTWPLRESIWLFVSVMHEIVAVFPLRNSSPYWLPCTLIRRVSPSLTVVDEVVGTVCWLHTDSAEAFSGFSPPKGHARTHEQAAGLISLMTIVNRGFLFSSFMSNAFHYHPFYAVFLSPYSSPSSSQLQRQ